MRRFPTRFFLQASTDGEKPHLYLHAINLVKDAEKRKGGVKAPQGTALIGVPLLRYLEASGLPRSAWTLDEALHDPSHVTALKSAADVCLHASKTEGFGLNVLECTATSTLFWTMVGRRVGRGTGRGVRGGVGRRDCGRARRGRGGREVGSGVGRRVPGRTFGLSHMSPLHPTPTRAV